ncbi:MAG: MarR family transcriptional regulator [Proteobacteria bacterium]|nr:MAG: MarR family transcriptional regulator [Pseudomonadota bacterium]
MGKSLATSKGSAWALLLTAQAVLVQKIEEHLAKAGLPPLAWYDVLWGLERSAQHRQRMSDLAERVVLSRSNLTRLVDRLEEAGLVRRERSEEDRRGAYAVLTESGKALRKKMWPVYQNAIRDLFEAHLSEEDAEALSAVLQHVLDAVRGQPAPEGG